MNKYMEKIALNRLVKELAKGTVTTPLEKLVSKGALRSQNRYTKGLRGYDERLRKEHGIGINNPKKASGATSIANALGANLALLKGGRGAIHLPSKDSALSFTLEGRNKQPVIHHEIMEHIENKNNFLRHPSEETRRYSPEEVKEGLKAVKRMALPTYEKPTPQTKDSLNRLMKHYKHNLSRGTGQSSVRGSMVNLGIPAGQHNNLSLIGHDSNLMRSNPHLKGSFVDQTRRQTGEADFLHRVTGKKFGEDKVTPRDLNKLRDHPVGKWYGRLGMVDITSPEARAANPGWGVLE